MSGHGRDLEYMAGCVAGRVARRIASPDRAGAIAEFSHTRRLPHGYAVAPHAAAREVGEQVQVQAPIR
jgi:hypothetical protein